MFKTTELSAGLSIIPFLETYSISFPVAQIESGNITKVKLFIYMTPGVVLDFDLMDSITFQLAKIPNYEFDCIITYAKPKTFLQWLRKFTHSLSIWQRPDKVHLSYKCSSV